MRDTREGGCIESTNAMHGAFRHDLHAPYGRTLADRPIRPLETLAAALEDIVLAVARTKQHSHHRTPPDDDREAASGSVFRGAAMSYLKSIRQELVHYASSPHEGTAKGEGIPSVGNVLYAASCVGVAMGIAWKDLDMILPCLNAVSEGLSVNERRASLGATWIGLDAKIFQELLQSLFPPVCDDGGTPRSSTSHADLHASCKAAEWIHAAFFDTARLCVLEAGMPSCDDDIVTLVTLIVAEDVFGVAQWCMHPPCALKWTMITKLVGIFLQEVWRRQWSEARLDSAFRPVIVSSTDPPTLPIPSPMIARLSPWLV